MTYNMSRAQEVRALLEGIPNVTEKKMFGSDGFIVNGKLCIGVGDHDDHCMMVRVGRDIYEQALKKAGAHLAIMRGREMNGYIFLTEDALKTQKDLKCWVDLALSYNSQIVNG